MRNACEMVSLKIDRGATDHEYLWSFLVKGRNVRIPDLLWIGQNIANLHKIGKLRQGVTDRAMWVRILQ